MYTIIMCISYAISCVFLRTAKELFQYIHYYMGTYNTVIYAKV